MNKTKLLLIIGILVAVVAGIYVAGNVGISSAIRSNYQSKNCEQVFALADFYTKAYPAVVGDKDVPNMLLECSSYTLAIQAENEKNWQNAYKAYQAYKQTYPKGLFTHNADDGSAKALVGWAKEQLSAGQATNALANLDLVLKDFATTSAVDEANKLTYETYVSLAANQRDSGDFVTAEATLNKLIGWATNYKKNDYVTSAKGELEQTYVSWALSFQKAQKFEDAQAKLELAASITSNTSKKNMVQLHTEWATQLVSENHLDDAIAHYQTALSLADQKDQPVIQDQVVNIHLKLAENLSNQEDFLNALKEIEQAKTLAGTDEIKKTIETVQNKIYQAFSQSSGEQARTAMLAAAQKICLHQQPELPIFGLDTDKIQAYLFVNTEERKLNDGVRATTPASMRYVGCVVESTKTKTMKNSVTRMSGRHPGTVPGSNYTIEFVTIYWNIQLYNIKTGNKIASQVFVGGSPASSIMYDNNAFDDITVAGTEPNLGTISAWIKNYLK